MEYGEAEDLANAARREAEGIHEPLETPEDEDLAAREELRLLVGRRPDPPTPPRPAAGIPPNVDNVPTPQALQALRGNYEHIMDISDILYTLFCLFQT